MIKTTVKNNIKFPEEFLIIDDLQFIAERIFIPELAGNIQQGTAITGGPLPKNDPKTIKRKGSARPLIDTGKLHRSFTAQRLSKSAIRLTLTSDRKDIGRYLQVDGIRTKTGPKHYRFFGINDSMEKAAIAHYTKLIKKRIRAFNGR